MKKLITICSFFLLGTITFVFAQQKESYPFEKEIIAFKKLDAAKTPEKNGVLFIGSSSIRLWDDLEKRFSDKPIIKRGVGGCELSHFVDHYMDAIVYPYKARQIFVYAGENDIVNGKKPKEVADNFKKLWEMIREKQPDVSIFYLSIKPSSSRTDLQSKFERTNLRIKKFLRGKANGTYIDLASVVEGPDGKPNDNLFESDRLHLNSRGYDRWEVVLRQFVK
ncbi:hypothetical protein H8S90_07640 [Olivibacter sp. SDN3]|uniref:GDSL-type esterase/lipase family protein n=1 Tax=Olivibacter sp. SDN3 TaxID=2764720 RepID=UPI001650D887|nr:GDSL-type esterase/lipase family protein [Olivibacter sp. SDN3]QNL51439.1 hypothetical protein H8S90_07640 [Olivibacter sp. SDN3]